MQIFPQTLKIPAQTRKVGYKRIKISSRGERVVGNQIIHSFSEYRFSPHPQPEILKSSNFQILKSLFHLEINFLISPSQGDLTFFIDIKFHRLSKI